MGTRERPVSSTTLLSRLQSQSDWNGQGEWWHRSRETCYGPYLIHRLLINNVFIHFLRQGEIGVKSRHTCPTYIKRVPFLYLKSLFYITVHVSLPFFHPPKKSGSFFNVLQWNPKTKSSYMSYKIKKFFSRPYREGDKITLYVTLLWCRRGIQK